MHCMVLRLFLIYIFLYSACYAEKSVKEVQAYNMIEKAKAENVIQAGLINAIYFLNTEYFVLEGENRKIRNPLYSPEQARDYVNLLIRTLNLSRVDVLAKMIDEIHMVEICVSKLVKKYKELWTPSKDFYDRLKLISKDFTKRYNNIVAMAEEDKTFDGFIYKKCGFYEPGNTSLQRSLYYQGFNPEFCKSMIYENKYGGMDQPPLNMTPSDEDLKTDVVPRDARKAYQYAILNSTLFDTSNYANLCLNGIGTEKRPDIAALVFSRSVFWNWSAEDIVKQKKEAAFRWDTREYFMPLYAYMLYNGIEIKKDKAKCDTILMIPIYNECWKNFYCGWFAPKDFEFAVYCLELLNKKVSEGNLEEILKNIEDKPLKLPAEYLAEIYEGKFNPKHKDPKKASYWRDIADKQKNTHLLKQ